MNYEKYRVLLVDDLGLARERVRQDLLKIGFKDGQVDSAVNGADGLRRLIAAVAERKPFALVISDWNMPEMNGLELLKACRAHGDLKAIKFMVVSSESETNAIVDAIDAGADDYAVKPITLADLTTKVAKLLS